MKSATRKTSKPPSRRTDLDTHRPILIAGASGILGTDLSLRLPATFGGKQVISLSRTQLDIASWDSVRAVMRDLRPRVVLNAAAYTNVDGAESDRETAYRVNVAGVENLANLCDEVGARLVQFSTDQVFDGTGSRAWTEEDQPNPLNHYAETKLLGEEKALRLANALVIRVQWLYGRKKDRFTLLRDREIFTPFSDQFGAPMYVWHLANWTVQLIEKDASGIFHVSYDDFASWAEVYQFVIEVMGFKTRLVPKTSEEIPLPAKRPKFSVLSNQKVRTFLGQPSLGSWKDALNEFLLSRES